MIKRERLLKQLNRLLDMEKSLVPLLNKHVSSSLTFSDLSEADQSAFAARLQDMARIHERHVEELTIMRDRAAGSDIDVY
jgi:hypothetical protein